MHSSVVETGKPKYFDVDRYLDAVEDVIKADEVINAIWMLDNMPGFYRDNVPQRAKAIRSKLYQQLMTVVDYSNDTDETKEASESILGGLPLELQYKHPHYFPRAETTINIVQELNSSGFKANIVEVGPANYWLPSALKHLGCDFSYKSYSVNKNTSFPIELIADSGNEKSKNIFACFEVIEHLWNPKDIVHFYFKSGMDADFILMSTPKYTLYGGLDGWNIRTLGHLRTYTPKELHAFGESNWPGFVWTILDSDMMVLYGRKAQ